VSTCPADLCTTCQTFVPSDHVLLLWDAELLKLRRLHVRADEWDGRRRADGLMLGYRITRHPMQPETAEEWLRG
jgi:hypothetical protein